MRITRGSSKKASKAEKQSSFHTPVVLTQLIYLVYRYGATNSADPGAGDAMDASTTTDSTGSTNLGAGDTADALATTDTADALATTDTADALATTDTVNALATADTVNTLTTTDPAGSTNLGADNSVDTLAVTANYSVNDSSRLDYIASTTVADLDSAESYAATTEIPTSSSPLGSPL